MCDYAVNYVDEKIYKERKKNSNYFLEKSFPWMSFLFSGIKKFK